MKNPLRAAMSSIHWATVPASAANRRWSRGPSKGALMTGMREFLLSTRRSLSGQCSSYLDTACSVPCEISSGRYFLRRRRRSNTETQGSGAINSILVLLRGATCYCARQGWRRRRPGCAWLGRAVLAFRKPSRMSRPDHALELVDENCPDTRRSSGCPRWHRCGCPHLSRSNSRSPS